MIGKAISLVAVTGLVAFSGLVDSARAAEPAVAKSTVNWQANLDAAHAKALQSGRPMMIVFRADWCVHCNRFESTTLTNPTMAKFINKNFVSVKMDFDKEKKAARILEVKALPCTVILSPKADLLKRIVGTKVPKDFWEALQDAKDKQAQIRQARFAAGE